VVPGSNQPPRPRARVHGDFVRPCRGSLERVRKTELGPVARNSSGAGPAVVWSIGCQFFSGSGCAWRTSRRRAVDGRATQQMPYEVPHHYRPASKASARERQVPE